MAIRAHRCAICGNEGWHPGAPAECTHCGFEVDDPRADMATLREAVAARLAPGAPLTDVAVGPGWRVGGHALRNALWAFGRTQRGDRIVEPDPLPHQITLGIIARAADRADVEAMIGDLHGAFGTIIVMVDGTEPVADWNGPAGMKVRAHPMDGDFAAQRNRVQALAGDGWVLQLDTDERPEPPLLAALGWLVAAADVEGLVSLGLPRRNLVDGQQSALWPDIQYRLNRAEVRFAGQVHERPVAPFAQTSLALCGAIEHRLSSARVRERSRTYEAMSVGAGRPEDEDALLRRFTTEA